MDSAHSSRDHPIRNHQKSIHRFPSSSVAQWCAQQVLISIASRICSETESMKVATLTFSYIFQLALTLRKKAH